MKRIFALMVLTLVSSFHTAFACDPNADWSPPTVAEAYKNAKFVIHATWLSETGEVKLIKVYKGSYAGKSIIIDTKTSCGVHRKIGNNYIFFLDEHMNGGNSLTEPRVDLQTWNKESGYFNRDRTQVIIEEIRKFNL